VNVKEYISSGIVESYVLGLATEAEGREFETFCVQYPEIAEAKASFELALEQRLLQDAILPPAQIKAAIQEKLLTTTEEEPVHLQESETTVKSIGPWKWLAAASLILLAGTVFWSLTTYNRYKTLEATNRNLQNQLEQSTAQLKALRQDALLLQKPEVVMAAMKGTTDPRMYATVYWDTASKDVYLMVNNLPQPASDKQYQLWALLNGNPINLGMIEVKEERLLVRMKNVENAQAFAITLEPIGGSALPTTQPLVMSKL